MRKRWRGLAACAILGGMMFVPLGCGSSSGNGGTGPNMPCNTSMDIIRLQPLSEVPDGDDIELGPVSVEVRPPDNAPVEECSMTWDGTIKDNARVWKCVLTGIVFDKRYQMFFRDESHGVRPNGNPMPPIYLGATDPTPEGWIFYNSKEWPFGQTQVKSWNSGLARIEPVVDSGTCSIMYQ